MATNMKLTDLIDYTTVLPYASELFGTYQPLLGWKSKRIVRRFARGFERDKQRLVEQLRRFFEGQVQIHYDKDCQVRIEMSPGALDAGKIRSFNSVVMEEISKKLPAFSNYVPENWPLFINAQSIDAIMKSVVVPAYTAEYSRRCKALGTRRASAPSPARERLTAAGAVYGKRRAALELSPDVQRKLFVASFEDQLKYESSLAGTLLFLTEHQLHTQLEKLFYKVSENSQRAAELVKILNALQAQEAYMGVDTLDPQDANDIKNVALSPISVVHLFRQYFFELDTFLGSPVSHVWLSPGSTVELIESHTLKTTQERIFETETTTTIKSEIDKTVKDELSEAVKEENNQDIKFGASVSASYMSITASSKFDYGTSQKTAREQTHKQMREQTEKLSTEIRNNYKTTFRTVTETTDTSSKRYILTNTTNQLVNYELRRKMRQIAVQVQDIGSYLAWQTYVDNPGEELGVAQLMHIAQPADLDSLHAPDEIPMAQPFSEEKVVTVPFVSLHDTDADNEGEVYIHGVEADDSEVAGNLELIQATFNMEAVCPKGNYLLDNVLADGQGQPVSASLVADSITNSDNKASFQLHLDSVDFRGQNSVNVKLTYFWTPGPNANDEAIAKNKANTDKFNAQQALEYQKAYVKTAKERIKLSHGIKPRPSEELREEERIVIYRKLIQDMLTNGVAMPDDRTRHVVAELLNSIFDIDKMLYFVAPEWWRPHYSHAQQLGSAETATEGESTAQNGVSAKNSVNETQITEAKLAAHTMGWGGINDANRDNYLITEDSEPAQFGSSLGWLLQLDGDNMRNAFLNAPWVKAVIPIRPTKEFAAINWLKGVEGFNGIGDNDIYQTNNPDEKDINGFPLNGQKMIDVLIDLAKKIQKKYEEGLKTGQYPSEDELGNPPLVDPGNVVTATPIDRVYEHGFYPLQGGFRANVGANFEVFDQWIEILPTDQVVPVEVKYSPRTGRQIDITDD